jgi:multidrug efflux system membrane fusion protein
MSPGQRHPRVHRLPWVAGVLALLVVAYVAATLTTHSASNGAASTGTSHSGSGWASGPGGDSNAVPVIATSAQRGDMPVYLTGLGTVTALKTVTVHTRVDGQLVSVNFTEGQLVHEGDLLAVLDPRPFQVQLEQAEGQRAKDEAALHDAQLDLKRYQVLVEQDAISRQQLDLQVATVNQAEGALKSDQAQIDAAKLNLTYANVTSPITGRIGLRLIDPGNIVHASDPNGLVVITERQPIAVVFTIPEDSLGSVLQKERSGAKLPVDAYDRNFKTKLASGMLSSIDSAIDTTTGTIKLKATFANEHETLFPNQFVNARLQVDTLRNVVIVPSAAIQRGPQQTFVYVVKPGNTVELRNVKVALTESDRAGIQSGLHEGELVVTDGVDKLQAGSKVTARPAGAQSTSDAS